MQTIRFKVWDHDDEGGMPVHEKTFLVFEDALGMGNALMVASYEARSYRDGYFAGQGWIMEEPATIVPEGGSRGDVSIGMGERLDWSITLDG